MRDPVVTLKVAGGVVVAPEAVERNKKVRKALQYIASWSPSALSSMMQNCQFYTSKNEDAQH